MGLEYVDIFYHHRPDPETPLEETMSALDLLIRQGKPYTWVFQLRCKPPRALPILKNWAHLLNPSDVYSMFNRWAEEGLLSL